MRIIISRRRIRVRNLMVRKREMRKGKIFCTRSRRKFAMCSRKRNTSGIRMTLGTRMRIGIGKLIQV